MLASSAVQRSLRYITSSNINSTQLHRYWCLDVRVRLIADQFKVFVFEIEQGVYIGIKLHEWQWKWFSSELLFRLFQVIGIQMGIAKGMNKLARLQASYLGDHHC